MKKQGKIKNKNEDGEEEKGWGGDDAMFKWRGLKAA